MTAIEVHVKGNRKLVGFGVWRGSEEISGMIRVKVSK